jgi:hypothetical protein
MDHASLNPALRLNRPGRPVIERMKEAIAVVRAHAIETGDLTSIRLVRILRDATSPEEIAEAGAAFRAWAVDRRLGTTAN